MGRARDISKVFSTGTALATDTEVSTTYQTKAAAGLTLLTPTSIVATGGSATSSISSTGTVSFTSASAISLNDVFSTTYDNYKLLFVGTTSLENTINLRMRVSGADNSTSNYYFQRTLSKNGNDVQGGEALATTSWAGFNTNTTNTIIEVELFSPFLATATTFLGRYEKVETLATVHETGTLSGIHNVASSFTGVTYTVGGGTITGTVSVYGYNK